MKLTATAMQLMLEALAILDEAGEGSTLMACQLASAIDAGDATADTVRCGAAPK